MKTTKNLKISLEVLNSKIFFKRHVDQSKYMTFKFTSKYSLPH